MLQRPAPDSPEVLALVNAGLPLVEPVARELRVQLSPQISRDDLVSFAHEGLLLAARTFDPARGVRFERWARVKLRGAMLEGLRRQSELSRRLHARLRAVLAANDAEEGLLEGDGSAIPSTPEAADARLTDYLVTMATSLALGPLTIRDGDRFLDELEDGRESVEEQAIRAQLKSRVRAAIAERPPHERAMLERYYIEEMPLEEASGGMSRSWASRLLAKATRGVARSLRRAQFEP